MSQHDMVIDNAAGATVRSDLNNALQALASTGKGNSRPSTPYAGQLWVDDNTPSSAKWSLFLYDGTDDIRLGHIDTTNNLFYPAWTGQSPSGRLTLTSGTAITTADVTAATAVYYTPFKGNGVAIYDGTAMAQVPFAELTLTLNNPAHAADTNYDVFVFFDPSDGTTVRVGTGPAWSSATARGTGAGTTEIQTITGIDTNKVQITARNGGTTYTVAANKATKVGSVRTTGTAGQTEDSSARRFVSNDHNQAARPFYASVSGGWTYNSTTIRASNANTTYGQGRVGLLLGSDQPIDAVVEQLVDNGGSVTGQNFVGVDSTTASSNTTSQFGSNGTRFTNTARYVGAPGVGFHYLQSLENCQSAASVTFNGGANQILRGTVLA